jgi:hypothetical protein
MLDHPPQTDFNVTLGFSLFCTILLWTKNRMWVTAIDGSADIWGSRHFPSHIGA